MDADFGGRGGLPGARIEPALPVLARRQSGGLFAAAPRQATQAWAAPVAAGLRRGALGGGLRRRKRGGVRRRGRAAPRSRRLAFGAGAGRTGGRRLARSPLRRRLDLFGAIRLRRPPGLRADASRPAALTGASRRARLRFGFESGAFRRDEAGQDPRLARLRRLRLVGGRGDGGRSGPLRENLRGLFRQFRGSMRRPVRLQKGGNGELWTRPPDLKPDATPTRASKKTLRSPR